MAKKNKLQEMDQVDGKLAGGSSFRTLDALIGEDCSHPYKQANISDYEVFLGELNCTDLHRHAQKVGLVPSADRRVLKERLLREFRKFIASRSFVSTDLVKKHMNQDSSSSRLSASAQKILREGA
jgi:hypothetical protein